jgi:hypothetical protein
MGPLKREIKEMDQLFFDGYVGRSHTHFMRLPLQIYHVAGPGPMFLELR